MTKQQLSAYIAHWKKTWSETV